MDIYLGSALAFGFNLLIWLPFINQVYSQDIASGQVCVDRARRGWIVWYRDQNVASIGHYFLIWFMRLFFAKENAKAFYSLMALYNALTGLGVYWLVASWQGIGAGIMSSALFAAYNCSPRLEGNWAPFEQLISLPLVWSMVFLLADSAAHPWLFPVLAGLFLGWAVLIKQNAAAYVPGYLLMAHGAGLGWLQVLYLLAALATVNLLPALYFGLRYKAMGGYLTCVWLHLLPSALFPNKYNHLYPSIMVRGHLNPEQRKQRLKEVGQTMPLLGFLAIAGFSPVLWPQADIWLALGFAFCLLASVWAIFMRGTFFGHYFLNCVPWLAIPAGAALWSLLAALASPLQLSASQLFAWAVLIYLGWRAYQADRHYYGWSKDEYDFLRRAWGDSMVQVYRSWKNLGEYIKQTTQPEDKILICGWVPQVLLHADRDSFSYEYCLHTKDYYELYSGEDTSIYAYLKQIFKFSLVGPRPNPFRNSAPAVIVFLEDQPDLEGMQKLSGMIYKPDPQVPEGRLIRLDPVLSKLMKPFAAQPSQSLTPQELQAMRRELQASIGAADWPRTIDGLLRLLASQPGDPELVLLLADALLNNEQGESAVEMLDRLLASGRFSDQASLALFQKMIYLETRTGNIQRARQRVQIMLQRKPGNPQLMEMLRVLAESPGA
jgi:hypothetical protein